MGVLCLDYFNIEKPLLSLGLQKYFNSEGANFTYSKGDKHRIIFERLRHLKNGGTGGYAYAAVLHSYKHKCSKNGHICINKLENENELRSIVEQVIKYFNNTY